jgi:hypothetical protein
MRSGPDLYAWLASLPPSDRDAAVERMLGLGDVTNVPTAPPAEHLLGHHMIGVSAIVRALHALPIREDDVVLDLGAGLGKLVALVHLFTGAHVRGVEIQSAIAEQAISNVEHGDARTCSLDANVIFLYCPFEGAVLEHVCRRLDALDDVVVCALGVDLPCTRLRPRPGDDFWMTIWDSGEPRIPIEMSPLAQCLAHDRADHLVHV